LLGAIAYVAYRKAKRRNRVIRQSSPETDAVIWFLGAILVFWPIALAWVIHDGLKIEDKTKYWLMALAPGILLLTLIPLGWEVYFLYGFGAAATAILTAVWQEN
jgi:hypothetical protein